jgi:hypothetical protein
MKQRWNGEGFRKPDHHTGIRKEQDSMKQRWYWLIALLAALTALALSGSTMAAERQVPFKGQSSGIVKILGTDPVTGSVSYRVEGTGKATLLGRFTVVGDGVIDGATGTPLGNWTLTTANGDQLFLTFVGGGIDPTHGFGTFTVVGGTGRFKGATGSYYQLITFSAEPGSQPSVPYTDVLTGTIVLRSTGAEHNSD